MKALVTGASGFIGSTLIEELCKSGHEVHALMRKTSSVANLAGCDYRKVEGSLDDFESLKRAVKDVDVVFHLAGVTAAFNREGYFESNARGTERLARAVAESNPGLKRFVYVSSMAAGGPASDRTPKRETDPDQPLSLYGQSKLQGEKELLKYKDVYPISILRPPMVYGPKDKGVFVIIQSVARGMAPYVPGSSEGGHKYYSVIHSRDLVQSMILAAQAGTPSGEVFYVAHDQIHTFHELLDAISHHLRKSPWRLRVPKFGIIAAAAGASALAYVTRKAYPLNWDKLNEVLPDFWICSNEKAKARLGFKPEYDLARGMGDAITWYKNQRWI